MLGALVLTCRKIREEAQPILAASIHLKILDHQYEIRDLASVAKQVYLSKIQQVTLVAFDETVSRHEHRFDVRQMHNLKTVYFIEP